MECSKCKNEITEDAMVCPYCKKVLKLQCPKCKTVNKSNICRKCGFVIISKCHKCGKINQTINGKCSKCGFSTYTSVAISTSNIDEFACLTVEFPNIKDLKSVLGSTKLADKFKINLDNLIAKYAGSVGLVREIIDDVLVLRFNKDVSFKTSAKNAMKAAIDILNQITELNYKLNKLKNSTIQCKVAILKRDISSPPESYRSGFDIKLIYLNKNSFKLINSLQAITDAAIYEKVCDDFDLSSLSSTIIKGEMVMFFELNLKKYIKPPIDKPVDDTNAFKIQKINQISEDENFEDEDIGGKNKSLYNVDGINFNELKCEFARTKSINLVPEIITKFKHEPKQIISIKSKNEILPRTEDFLINLEASNVFEKIFRVTCTDEMKYQPYGFFHQLLSVIYNFAQSPQFYNNNDFEIFKQIDESEFIKSLINFETRTFPHPEDIRYSLFDIFLNIFNHMKNVLIYIENFEKIDETSYEVLQLIFEKLNDLNVGFLIIADNDFSLHKKSYFLLNNSSYTEITVKPTSIKEIIEKNMPRYEKIIDSYYLTTIADNTKGSLLYFEHSIEYLLEKCLLRLEKDNSIYFDKFENVHIPSSLNDLIARRLSHLHSNDPNAYNLLCMLVLTGPIKDLSSIKLFGVPKDVEAINLLSSKRYLYVYKNMLYIQNYNLLRQNILSNMSEDEVAALADEIQKKVYNLPEKHPCESTLFNLQRDSKNEFIVWETLSNLSYSMGDFSAYLNCSVKLLKLLDEHVNESSEKTIEDYKMEIYENISSLLYKYSPNEIYNISRIILENLEKTTNNKKVISLCNKMLQGCLIGGNYSYALDLTRKILSKFSNPSLKPEDDNFELSYFLISLVKIEVLFSIGNLKDCIEAGDEILDILKPDNISALKPHNLSLAQFEYVIFDAMTFVLISKVLLLQNSDEITSFLTKIRKNVGRLPAEFEMYAALLDIAVGNRVENIDKFEVTNNKFSSIIFNIINAFSNYSNDYEAFADTIYQAKIKAKLNKLTQIELVCDLLIGYAYFKLNNLQKAEHIYYNILDISTKNGLKFVTYLDWYFISLLKFEQNEFDSALGIANNAMIQLEQDNTCGDLLFFLFRTLLANIYGAKNEKEASMMCYSMANFIKEKHGLNFEIDAKFIENIEGFEDTSEFLRENIVQD